MVQDEARNENEIKGAYKNDKRENERTRERVESYGNVGKITKITIPPRRREQERKHEVTERRRHE